MAKVWGTDVLPDLLNQLYQRVLERPADPAGTITFGCILNRGEQSVRDIVGVNLGIKLVESVQLSW